MGESAMGGESSVNTRNISAFLFLLYLTGSAIAEPGFGKIPEDKIYKMKFIISKTAKNIIMTNFVEDGCPDVLIEIRNIKFNEVNPGNIPGERYYNIAGEMDSIRNLVGVCYSKKNRKIIKPIRETEHLRFTCQISETESGDMKFEEEAPPSPALRLFPTNSAGKSPKSLR
jgi:hypothetical protein